MEDIYPVRNPAQVNDGRMIQKSAKAVFEFTQTGFPNQPETEYGIQKTNSNNIEHGRHFFGINQVGDKRNQKTDPVKDPVF